MEVEIEKEITGKLIDRQLVVDGRGRKNEERGSEVDGKVTCVKSPSKCLYSTAYPVYLNLIETRPSMIHDHGDIYTYENPLEMMDLVLRIPPGSSGI